MKLSDFDYNLPKDLIATHPVEPRDSAKMLVLDKNSGKTVDSDFKHLTDFLHSGDVLVFNKSKVIPARLFGKLGERLFEVLLVKNVEGPIWECWVKGGRKLKEDDILIFSEKLSATYKKRENEIFYLMFNLEGSDFFTELEKIGQMPVPPYILKERKHNKENKIDDLDDYQTVFADKPGSVAAPTAGLHFTEELLENLKEKGVQLEYVTLHVGLGTFQPINTENVEDFEIHSEYFEIDPETAKRITAAKTRGNRVISVGTTTTRVLESSAAELKSCDCANKYGLLPKMGETKIYIYPGYKFKIIDGLITNFHLPKSSLLVLVSALAKKDVILDAYNYAIRKKYRFYSYGDGMLIL